MLLCVHQSIGKIKASQLAIRESPTFMDDSVDEQEWIHQIRKELSNKTRKVRVNFAVNQLTVDA